VRHLLFVRHAEPLGDWHTQTSLARQNGLPDVVYCGILYGRSAVLRRQHPLGPISPPECGVATWVSSQRAGGILWCSLPVSTPSESARTLPGRLLKLADRTDLGSVGETRESSSLSPPTPGNTAAARCAFAVALLSRGSASPVQGLRPRFATLLRESGWRRAWDAPSETPVTARPSPECYNRLDGPSPAPLLGPGRPHSSGTAHRPVEA
jgi:hypothetical protein